MLKVRSIRKVIREEFKAGSLPDVDLDFESKRRDDVKRYMENKYGKDYVAAIGTYSTFKIKSSIKDLCRERGGDFSKVNYISGMIDDAKTTLTGLFKLATEKPDLKKFIQKNYKIIEDIPLVMGQVKTASVHASGVVVVPKTNGTIYNKIPVRSMDNLLVTEWEGEWLDLAGFLKFDILGVKQLDKFSAITKLIKNNSGKDVSYDSMTLNDPDVMQLFCDGMTEDVFQFGTQGLKAYCKEMKPDNVNDLIAAVALYRPGTMDTGMHKEFIKIKHGLKKPIKDEGTWGATKETYGIAVYQEQVMQITKDVAGFDLVLADDVRKAMGKKKKDLLDSYKEKFIEGGRNKGFSTDYLTDLWGKLETFSGYGFNKSHAACYAIMGYFSQWLKYYFPIEFWTVSLQFAEDKEIINRISEISKISNIEVSSVDVNKSTETFYADRETSTVYWSLTSVKFVGEKAVNEILQERNENGEFFSVEDFVERTQNRNVDKRVICNLILSGAFDQVERVFPYDRWKLLDKYVGFSGKVLADDLVDCKTWKKYQWVLKQKELTGFGFIDYENIIKSSDTFASKYKIFEDNSEVLFADADDEETVVVAGVLQNVIERKSRKGPFCQLEIIDNTDKLFITVWNDVYEEYKSELNDAINKIVIVSGRIKFDGYKQSNVIHTTYSSKIEVI